MADEVKASESASWQSDPSPANTAASEEERLAESLPPDERDQPDAELALSYGRLGAGGITLAAIICALILAVVFYGLNSAGPNAQAGGAQPKVAAAQVGGAAGAPNAQPAK